MPTTGELLPVVRATVAALNGANRIALELDAEGVKQLAKNLTGLGQAEALRMCVLARRKMDAGLLETVRRDTSFTDIAGLTRLRSWIAKRKSAFTPEGKEIRTGAAEGDFDYRRTGLREEFGGAVGGG